MPNAVLEYLLGSFDGSIQLTCLQSYQSGIIFLGDRGSVKERYVLSDFFPDIIKQHVFDLSRVPSDLKKSLNLTLFLENSWNWKKVSFVLELSWNFVKSSLKI